MANTFKLKRSSVPSKVPTTGDLQLGELALNTYDGKLYTKKDNGTASIVEIGAGGGGGGLQASAAQAYNTLSVSGVTTAAAVSFGAETFDSDNIWTSGSPTRLTVPSTGVYRLEFSALVTFTAETYVLTFSLRKNGVEARSFVYRENWRWFSGDTFTVAFSDIQSLAVTDYLEVFHSGDSTGYSIGTAAASRAQFSIHRVS